MLVSRYRQPDYSASHYAELEARADAIEDKLDRLYEDEDCEDGQLADEIAELEAELGELYGEMGEIDEHWLTRDYYASVL